MGSASRLRRSVSSIASVRIGRPTSARLTRLDALGGRRAELAGAVFGVGRPAQCRCLQGREDAAESGARACRRLRGRRAGSPGSTELLREQHRLRASTGSAAVESAASASSSCRYGRTAARFSGTAPGSVDASSSRASRAASAATARRWRGLGELGAAPRRRAAMRRALAPRRMIRSATERSRRTASHVCARRTTAAAAKSEATATPVSQGRPGAASSDQRQSGQREQRRRRRERARNVRLTPRAQSRVACHADHARARRLNAASALRPGDLKNLSSLSGRSESIGTRRGGSRRRAR